MRSWKDMNSPICGVQGPAIEVDCRDRMVTAELYSKDESCGCQYKKQVLELV